jgi:hypothetical protein
LKADITSDSKKKRDEEDDISEDWDNEEMELAFNKSR